MTVDDGSSDWRVPGAVSPFMRQMAVACAVWVSYFHMGLCLGGPTVFIRQLRSDPSFATDLTDEMISWLTSAYHYSAVPWGIALPLLAGAVGRRPTFIFVALSTVAGLTLFYFSTSITHILISDAIIGVVVGCSSTVSLMILTEYIAPEHRGLFLAIKSASGYWGMWTSNALGSYLTWRSIPIAGLICSVLCLGLLPLWPESPYWLASRARPYAARRSLQALRKDSANARQELDQLLHLSANESPSDWTIKNALKGMAAKEFYKPLLLCAALMAMMQSSCKQILGMYALDILEKMMSNTAAYSGMLALDGVTVFGMMGGCVLARVMRRRTLLFGAEAIGIVLLVLLALYLYLVQLQVIAESTPVAISLLVGVVLAMSCGPIILVTSICGELAPLKHRALAMVVISLLTNLTMATTLKTAPAIFKAIGLHGGFLLYAAASLIFLVILYVYLPETKNRTLNEIQDYFRGEKTDKRAELEAKELVLSIPVETKT